MIQFGEVRNITDDETKSGRVLIRIYNKHDDEVNIKDEHLAWAMPLMPSHSASTNKVGIAPTGLQVGSRVAIMYGENDTEKQYPIIIGSFYRAFPSVTSQQESDSAKDGFDSVNKKEAGVDLPSGANPNPAGGKENLGKNPINPKITPDDESIPTS